MYRIFINAHQASDIEGLRRDLPRTQEEGLEVSSLLRTVACILSWWFARQWEPRWKWQVRQLKEQYYNTSGITSSRSMHDFTMLSYIRALPGWCKQLRTLRLHNNSQSEQPFSTQNVDELSALVLERDGSMVLIETDFKNVRQVARAKSI